MADDEAALAVYWRELSCWSQVPHRGTIMKRSLHIAGALIVPRCGTSLQHPIERSHLSCRENHFGDCKRQRGGHPAVLRTFS
jgi:hypothetical protein